MLIDADLWARTRSGARAGRGFRYQDAVGGWLVAEAWRGTASWSTVIPEGVDDLSLHGHDREFRAQLKSRHDPQATFSVTEVASFIAKAAADLPPDWEAKDAISLALILERPVTGLSADGFDLALGQSGQDLSPLVVALKGQLPMGFDVDALLRRTCIVVEPQPISRAIEALSVAELEPAGLNIVAQLLREAAGKAADENFAAKPPAVRALGRTDVQTRIDGVRGLLDPAGYLSLTAGLADVADFDAPVSADHFYEGVNTSPAHVGAGLVFERPDRMADILGALEERRVALVAGPSGSGKSGLAWLAAYHSRHAVRWYRVRRLLPDDVGRLATLVRRLDATSTRPVGFVVDDVGRDDTVGWDLLVREAEASPGMLLVGTVREEDVFTLSTASRTTIVRPSLDEALAARIWKALSDAEQSSFGHWQEPFDLSHGLLLEYVHLLTAGQRLADTIHEQVRRRLAEDRDVELVVLRAVAFASASGGAVDQNRLFASEGLDPIKFAKAMQRLLDEHAVRLRPDGSITGLHEIRSKHLDEAVRTLLGESRDVAVRAAVAVITADTFAVFIQRTLQQRPEALEPLLEAVANRLAEADAPTWVAVLHGLGLATADEVASKWVEISRDAEIEDRFSQTMFGLVIADSDLGDIDMFAGLKKAQPAFKAVKVRDLRKVVLDRLQPETTLPVLDVNLAHELSAALLPIHGAPEPPDLDITLVGEDLSNAPLGPFIALLETLRDRDVALAEATVNSAGGAEHLLSRLHQETPWMTPPWLGEFEGEPAVFADIRHIHPEIQPDVREDAGKLCARMAALAPGVERVVCNAIWVDGEPAGMGDYSIATLALVRRALPAPARVAWNRVQLRAIARLVATATETQRTSSLAQAIREVADWVRQAGDYYCRNERPDGRWNALLQIRKLLTSFVAPPSVKSTQDGPLAKGDLPGPDKLHGFIVGLQRLMTELTDGVSDKPALMASRTSDLAQEALALQDVELWRNVANPPIEHLRTLETTLWEIRAVLGDAANNPENRLQAALRFEKTSRHHSALRRAASDAHARAKDQIEAKSETIRQGFAERGLNVVVVSKPPEKRQGWNWPEAEYGVLLPVESVFDFLPHGETFIDAATALELPGSLAIAPVLRGFVPPIALLFINTLLPYEDFSRAWKDHIPFPLLPEDEERKLFERGMDALVAISATLNQRERDLIEEESSFQSMMVDRAILAVKTLAAAATQQADDLLAEVVGFLSRTSARLAEEEADPDKADTVAGDAIGVVRGTISEFSQEMIVARSLLIERSAIHAQASMEAVANSD